jgi:hypothetical protein
LLPKRAIGPKSVAALALTLALAGGSSTLVGAATAPDQGAHAQATAHTSMVGQQVTLFGKVVSLGSGSFTIRTAYRVDWTVTTSMSTSVYGEQSSTTSATPPISTLTGVSKGESVVIEGTVTATRTLGATSVIVLPRSLPNAATGAIALFGDVSATATGSFTLVGSLHQVAWTVDTTTSTAYIATTGPTSDVPTMTAMGAHLAVVGIVTGHNTISATGVFALAAHPGAQPVTSRLSTPTKVTYHPWYWSAHAFTYHPAARPSAAGRYQR